MIFPHGFFFDFDFISFAAASLILFKTSSCPFHTPLNLMYERSEGEFGKVIVVMSHCGLKDLKVDSLRTTHELWPVVGNGEREEEVTKEDGKDGDEVEPKEAEDDWEEEEEEDEEAEADAEGPREGEVVVKGEGE
jgi:hypothetical protein